MKSRKIILFFVIKQRRKRFVRVLKLQNAFGNGVHGSFDKVDIVSRNYCNIKKRRNMNRVGAGFLSTGGRGG